MITGLLICDHVPGKFRPIAGTYEDMFRSLFSRLHLKPYLVCDGHFPETLDECDAYLCTGSKYAVYDDLEWIIRLKGMVRSMYERRKPFAGICFGHQMMAEALGGKVEKAETGWCVGAHTFEVLQRENWMQPFEPTFSLLMLCQDQVKVLPENSTVLARTADCPVGVFRVGETMLGLQAHPEFEKAYNRAVMEDRAARLGQEKLAKGIASLEKTLQREMIATWISRFLKDPYAF